ncbi:phosphoglycolate phosphatase [Devosia crocina]|uniref:phosphoglycolate phosphatase n=1 Tax=Devosia crocina TaxID=429728 RepID=A0A1I7NJ90_9HYPH|nr:HAD hydrolase-like protein [Devosia crocina]SFV34713.1 phosphoglycolate phosphatase [Devosia crocina]
MGDVPLDVDLKRPTIVLFDLDGTLVHHVNPRVLQALEFLDDCSHRAGRLVARFRLMRRQRSGVPPKMPKLLMHRALHKVRRKSVEEMLEPCETLRAVLSRLREEGVVLGVVSNGLGRGYGHDVLEAFDLKKYFSAFVFREDVSRGKPWPDSILAALDGIGRNVRQRDVIWYIGDQRKDVDAALAASAKLKRPVTPVALGPRAALRTLDGDCPNLQVMWSASDLERHVAALFPQPCADEAFGPFPVATA